MAQFMDFAQLPSFSFVYGGRPSAELLPGWRRETSADGAVSYDDPQTGLRVTVRVRRFADFPAHDWVLEFENRGLADTPALEDVLPLDASVPAEPSQRVTLHHANGSLCRMDDFLPQQTDLAPGVDRTLAPFGGRSSNGVLPFMSIQRHGCGMVLAVGWSGQWSARFRRDGERLRLTAGMERTHLVLHPGEKIRTPRILALSWEGNDPVEGNNLLRRLLIAHYLPRIDGELVTPPVAQCLQFYYYKTGQAGENLEMTALPRAAAAGCDVYWIDACWYGDGTEWWQEVGTWKVNPKRFPHGLRPISDAARAAGMKFLLWFEPERVRRGSELHREHPEFLLSREEDPDNLLLDLGNPHAWSWLIERLSSLITENGVDIYRQDFNFDPLPYWRRADAPDRAGMAEIRHVEGHYRLWDELRRRHPGLWIDNCSSGGRRIDLETVSRSLPLWPSDFTDTIGLSFGMGLHVGDQCINAGLARWVPLFGGGVWNFTPYGTRGEVVGGFTFGVHIEREGYAPADSSRYVGFQDAAAHGLTMLDDEFPLEQARLAVAEQKSLRPFFLGDFYPLLPLTVAPHDWCAYQFHRQGMGAGCALFFRRHASPFPAMAVELRCIEPSATYEVSLSPDYEEAPRKRMKGSKLRRLEVTIPDMPGSMLLRYSRVE